MDDPVAGLATVLEFESHVISTPNVKFVDADGACLDMRDDDEIIPHDDVKVSVGELFFVRHWQTILNNFSFIRISRITRWGAWSMSWFWM